LAPLPLLLPLPLPLPEHWQPVSQSHVHDPLPSLQ
jgi:hypothetical protein